MKTTNVLSNKQVPEAVQARAFPLYDRRNGFVGGESLNITGLWEFEGGIFGYDFGNINHVVHAAYIHPQSMELVVTDRVLDATFIHEGNMKEMNSNLRVIKRHSFMNVFEATGYYSIAMTIKAQESQ